MNLRPDLLIVGAGPVGSVVAEQAASLLNWKCVVLDRRKHIAGNCHDRAHSNGILLHVYGPHYFRTNSEKLVKYLSQFTDWIPGKYIVKSFQNKVLYPFPINLTTLEKFYGRTFTPATAEEFISKIKAPISTPKNSEEFVLSRVGEDLYRAFYFGYTLKQWGIAPSELGPEVCGRIPVRFTRDESYVDHRYQLMPKDGFTSMFKKMLAHRNIEVVTNLDFNDVRKQIVPKYATLYTGPIDEYFNYCLGRLPWRSLKFDFVEYQKKFVQECVQINYPNDYHYTRSVEIKHVTGQSHPHSVLSYETPTSNGEPYYPMPMPASKQLYLRYAELAKQETRAQNVYFAGRLATYRYINTDEAIENAFTAFEQIRSKYEDTKSAA